MTKSIVLSIGLSFALQNYSVAANHLSNPIAYDLGVKDKAMLELAKQKIYGGQFKGALNMLNPILDANPTDGTTLYYVAFCEYNLKNFEKAFELLKKGKESPNPKNENFYLLGMIYLQDGKYDEALAEYNTYKSKASSKEANEVDVDVYISHCNNAKKMLASPIPVVIENLGTNVNSQYDDKGPCITADGKKIFFNSRRPETTDALVDVEGDGKFFEDIYFTTWDSAKAVWVMADEIPGSINTDAHDAVKGISADGKTIFIYQNNANGESRGGDIYISKATGAKWKTPEQLPKPINTDYWEGGACLSPDGKTLYFVSEREKGGQGRADIWMSKKIDKVKWGKPVNLGADVNSAFDEVGIFLAPDGKTLFFCSNGHGSMGSYDVFKTVLENGKWSKPVNLGYPFNTERSDGPLTLSADAKYAYISSDRKGGLGENDIYRVDLKDIAILEKDGKKKENNGLSILKGMARDVEKGGAGLEGVEVTIYNEAGENVASTTTNESGEYFITLKGNVKYEIKVSKKGYKEMSEKVDLKLGANGETFSLEKQFLMKK